jgi:hypothetical protein
VTVRRTLGIAVALVAVGFAALHVVGGRDCVAVLSGTPVGSEEEIVIGLAYVLGWFGVVLVAPIVVLAICLDAVCDKIVSAWRTLRRP